MRTQKISISIALLIALVYRSRARVIPVTIRLLRTFRTRSRLIRTQKIRKST